LKVGRFLFAVFLLVQSSAASAPLIRAQQSAQSRQQQRAQTAKIKSEVQKRGTGEKTHVKVTFHNKTKLKGYISKIGPDSFAVTDRKTRQVRIISYEEVDRIQ
jgi:hypothetical protein